MLGYPRAENRLSRRVLGADMDPAGPEGLVPELCSSAAPRLPQGSLQKGSVRELWGTGLWPSSGPISVGGYKASAASSRTWASMLLQQIRLKARELE